MMPRRSKIVLKHPLSRETLEAIRIYLREFIPGRHVVEHFDGTVSVYVYERTDVEIVQRGFPSLIASVRNIY